MTRVMSEQEKAAYSLIDQRNYYYALYYSLLRSAGVTRAEDFVRGGDTRIAQEGIPASNLKQEFSPLHVERSLMDEGPLCIIYQGEYEIEITMKPNLPGRSLCNSKSILGRMFRRLRQVFLWIWNTEVEK